MKKSQSLIVYVTLLGIVMTATIGISLYLRRSIQGTIRETADVFGQGAQYEPGQTVITEISSVDSTYVPPETYNWDVCGSAYCL